jgi:alkylation response protein AidB-like acyl-CoA dehydrogenase
MSRDSRAAGAPAGSQSFQGLPATLAAWLDRHADALDDGSHDAVDLLPALAEAGAFRWGVPPARGGIADSDAADAIEAIAAIAARSLTAAFAAWGQRAFIECLLRSPNPVPAERWLPDLLAGRMAGANALSNVMKFLSGLESLQIAARADGERWLLDGAMPWVTNARPGNYAVAAAVAMPEGGVAVMALPHDAPGLARADDLRLMGLQASSTAAIELRDVPAGPENLLHARVPEYLPGLRPVFVGLQCGWSIGLARRCLDEARQAGQGRAARGVLAEPIESLAAEVESLAAELKQGVRDGRLQAQPKALFRLRIGLTEAAMAAAQLELQAAGGAAYLQGRQPGFARRWREAAFLPVVTPSLVQLKTELARG